MGLNFCVVKPIFSLTLYELCFSCAFEKVFGEDYEMRRLPNTGDIWSPLWAVHIVNFLDNSRWKWTSVVVYYVIFVTDWETHRPKLVMCALKYDEGAYCAFFKIQKPMLRHSKSVFGEDYEMRRLQHSCDIYKSTLSGTYRQFSH